MVRSRLMALFIILVCLALAVPVWSEDQSDGFVPATGNEAPAAVVTGASSTEGANAQETVTTGSSGSEAVDAAVSDLSSALDSFFKALKSFFDALAQLFTSIFGGNARAAEISVPAATAPTTGSQTVQTAGGTAARPDDGQPATVQASQTAQTASSTTLGDTSGQAAAQSPSGQQADQNGVTISAAGREQMKRLIAYAKSHHGGGSNGDCFNFVWRYMTSSGYGKLRNWGDLPNMKSTYARHFSDYLNGGQTRLDEAGLQRLDTTLKPPITNPHDPRIPDGAVIVVSAGSYGTRDPVAGDIVVKAGPGHFINDGPNMDYGTKSSWYGKVMGVYVPK